MMIQIREGSQSREFDTLIPLLGYRPDRVMLCTDDLKASGLSRGHINRLVSRAVALGYDLFDVLAAATLNPIRHYRLKVGLLQPGDPADLICCPDLIHFTPSQVWIEGKRVDTLPAPGTDRTVNHFLAEPITTGIIATSSAGNELLRVIRPEEGTLITGEELIPAGEKGRYQKMIVLNRYAPHAPAAIGYVSGFNLQDGAFGSTIAHDSHNLIVTGSSDELIVQAANRLIAMQGGQLVAGFNKWKDTFHRTVKKGEKGIKILAPAPYKVKQKMEKLDEQGKPILDKDGKPLTEEKTVQIPAFKVVSVFDVSQTEGEPLPSIAVDELSGSVQDYQDFFKALEQVSPVPIGLEDIEGGAHGYFHLLDNRIAIQEGMSQLQTIKTAIHEIAHAKLHAIDPNDPEQTNRPDSRTREVQAESVAYAVCQYYGLDTSEYSFGYVAGWSSGRELAELKASLEIIRSAAHELISALDEHLAELRQQREADLSAAQEAAFALDNGNILFIQTCDSGYDYTLYDADKKALDGGQLDAPGLTLPDAGQEALNLLGQTAAVSEVLLGDKLAAFQEAAEKANEIPAPVKIPDPAAEPTVTILWSESDKLQDGEIMPLSVANRVFEELDTAQHTDREKDGYTGGWYDKTAFRIDFTLNGQPDNYEGRQDFGDGDGSLIQHIQSYHEYYAKDENWKNFVLHNKGPEAWEQDKAEREMVLTEFIPYLKQHCNLSAMEQTAATALQEGQNISPEKTAYYNAVVTYVQDCRPMLNQGQYNLPEPPKLADFDQSLQDYKAQVQAEIAQEAATAGMTVEEYAAAGFEAPQQDSFSIYQLRNEDSTRDYRFEPYDRLQAAGRTVDKSNYTEVYTAPLTAGTTLEDIYRTFNVDHPADFKGHSLSVSDVVVLHQNGQDTAHYCDSVGFQQVPEFLRENPLRTAELSTEQNENMIDGVLNNAPSLGELEAKAKAGEQISLTDLAAAVKAEEKAPKAKKSRTAKPKKPSIRAQLDAAKKEQSKQTLPREKTKELEV